MMILECLKKNDDNNDTIYAFIFLIYNILALHLVMTSIAFTHCSLLTIFFLSSNASAILLQHHLFKYP